MFYGQTYVPVEFCLKAGQAYGDVFNDVELDVIFAGPDDQQWRVPAFWAGDNAFRVRFAAPKPGRYTYRSVCTNVDDPGLHDQSGEIEIRPYDGTNALFCHGRLRVAPTKRTLEHEDGTPFFWLGDTWWMGLCKRLGWPGDFQTLTADRMAKGFTVIQIVAGLYPDMPAFDERGANEAGFPWEKDYERINPAYFDMADLRIHWLVRSGLVPCIVGAWGYHLPWLGVEKMKKHWRYLVARYGAYPVVWCLAGEWGMPYYLSKTPQEDKKFQTKAWHGIAAYVKEIDGFDRLRSIHEGARGRGLWEKGLIHFEMLQTGHGDRTSVPNTIQRVTECYGSSPPAPFLNSEVCYEGIGEACRQEVQRFMFWSCVLCGAAGHTYGANGIWQVNTREKPYGPSPHGMSWGDTPWDVAYQLPGSGQLGLAKRLLERYEWWRFEPHPEWVEPHANEQNGYRGPFAGGIPGEVRILFLPGWGATVKGLEPNVPYKASLFNPVSGREHEMGSVRGDEQGDWAPPMSRPPILQDWVLVLERETAAGS